MNQKPKHRNPGRPRLPKGQAKGKIVQVRLTDSEVKTFIKSAKARKQTISEWIRSALNAAV